MSSQNLSIDGLCQKVLAGTYRIERLLATGGIGAVFVATHLRTRGQVAIKFLSRGLLTEPEVLRRFREEAQILAALKHPHIVTLQDFVEDPEFGPFLVMELLPGRDLEAHLKEHGPLSFAEAKQMALQVGGAIQAAHDLGIVHRDVKPQNLFVVDASFAGSSQMFLKVLDFGVSKIVDRADEKTAPMMVLGTPHYMAPETAQGHAAEVDARSDQFSFAVVLFRALTGRKPFDSSDPMAVLWQVVHVAPPRIESLVAGIPSYAADAIARALSKEPSHRFTSVADFVRALFGASNRADFVAAVRLSHGDVDTLPPMLPPSPSSQSSIGGSAVESVAAVSPSGNRFLRRSLALGVAVLSVAIAVRMLVMSRRPPRSEFLMASDVPVALPAQWGETRSVPLSRPPVFIQPDAERVTESHLVATKRASPTPASKPAGTRLSSCIVPSIDCISEDGLTDAQRHTAFSLLRKFRLGACPSEQFAIFKALNGKGRVSVSAPIDVKRRKSEIEDFWVEWEGSLGFGRGPRAITVDGIGRGRCKEKAGH